MTIDLGGRVCKLIHIGGTHSADSIFVLDIKSKIMFIGDCLFYDLYSRNDNDYIEKLKDLINQLLSYDVKFYYPSHFKKLSRKSLSDFPHIIYDNYKKHIK